MSLTAQVDGNETLRRELHNLLGGLQRENMFAEVRRRHQEVSLVSDSYRDFLRTKMDSFADANRKTLLAIKATLVGTAVLRPAITIVLLGGPVMVGELTAQAAIHAAQEAAAQVTTHTMTHVAGEVAIGAAAAVGGDVAAAGAGKAGIIRPLIAQIVAGFYQERAGLLAEIVRESAMGDCLRRIRRLADVQHGEPLQSAVRIVAELNNQRG